MKKTTFLIYTLSLLLFTFTTTHVSSQINHALTATSSHSGGGATVYGPDNYNDDIIPAAGNLPWGWVSTGGWIEYTWTSPVTINSMVFYKDSRPMTIADLQYWDGTQYVSFYSYNSSVTPKDSISFPAVTTTRIRLDNVSGSSNPNHREIQALFVSSSPNDAGVTSLDAPTNFCAGMQDVYATISNTGTNQIDSVEVHWEFNGVPQPMVHYKQLLDTINGSFPNSASIMLGTVNFNAGSNNLKIYTSLPNGVADTSNLNDTLNVNLQTATPPTSLTTSNVTITSADVDIVGGIGSFDYEFGPTGFTLGTGTSGNTTTNPFTITGLLPNTTYEIYVRSNCGSGDVSTWVGPFSFVTPCTTFSAPYTEDFENLGTIPNCWNQGASNGENWIFSTSGGHVGNAGTTGGTTNSGGYFAYVDDSTPDNLGTTLESPFIDVSSLTTPALQFFLISNNEGQTNVEFSIDLWDGAAWNTDIYVSDTNTVNGEWEEILIALDTFTITGPIQLHFIVDENNPAGQFYDDVAIDDVSIIEAPTCFKPLNLDATNITLTSAQLSWTEVNLATTWQIEYGTTGFVPGTGTRVTATTNPYLLTGLSPSTTYDYYVRSACGRNDTSFWAGPHTFNTAMGVPFFEDFETFPAGLTSNPWPNGWTTTTTTDPNWESEDATGSNENSTATGPLYDHTLFGTPGGIYMYMETSSGTVGDTAKLISPPIYIDTNQHTLELGYWYFNHGADIEQMDVFIRSNGVTTLIASYVGQQQASQSDPWLYGSHVLTGYAGSSVEIIFSGINAPCCSGDLAVDDVSLVTLDPDDAGVAELSSPAGAICAGTVTPSVDVENYGSNTITTVDVVSSVNGVMDTVNYTGSILPGQFQTVALNPITFTAGTFYNIEIYTINPNGVADTHPSNDTLKLDSMRTGLVGNYTIDPAQAASSTNYQDFGSAASDLNTHGICGAVHFDVAAGTYNEQVTLNEVAGTSPVNTITFDGTDSSMVLLTHNGSIDRPTLLLNGTDHVTVMNMGISATGSSGTGVHLMNQANNNLFTNNYITVGTTSTSSLLNPILATSSTTSTSAEGDVTNNTTFANNLIEGGYYQIRIEGDNSIYAQGIEFHNNQLVDGYYYTMYADNMDGLVFNDNVIATTRGNVNGDGLYLFDIMNFEIEGNYIHAPDYALYISDANSDYTPSQRASIVNNMIISDSDYGILLYDALDVDIFHNSISVSGTTPALDIDNALTANVDIRNNIFAATAEAVDFGEPASSIGAMDHNIYYTTGTNLVTIDGVSYTDLASLQAAYPGMNASSLEGNPQFLSSTDLHLAGNFANNKGDNTVGVTTDIDGDPRPFAPDTTVDIGADEIKTISCSPPGAITAFNMGLNSGELTWNSPAGGFEYEYGTAGFTQGSGTTMSASNDSILISGLAPSTTYDFYIRAICGANDTSIWFGPFNFRTLTGVPFFEDFESFPPGLTSNPWPNGWTTTTTTDPNWESEDATGANENSVATGPLYDHTQFGTPGGIYMYMETSGGTVGDTAQLISPPIYVDTNQHTLELEYWYFNHGADIEQMDVFVRSNGVTTLIASYVGEQQPSQNDPWRLGSHLLTGYAGSSIEIIFSGINAPCCSGDLAVDDVSLTLVSATDPAITDLSDPVEDINKCYTATENVNVELTNVGQDPIDFTVDTAYVTVNVTGAATQTLNYTVDDNSLNSGTPLPSTSSINIPVGTLNMTAPGTYYFDVSMSMTNDGQLTNNTHLDTVTVLAPSGGLIDGPTTVCQGDTFTLSTVGSVGGLQWQSSTGGAYTDITGANTENVDVTPGAVTSYRVIACGSAISDTITLTPVGAPTTFGDTAIVFCGDSGTAVLRASSTAPNLVFDWYDAPVGGNLVHSGDTLHYGLQTASQAATTAYTDTFYVSNKLGGGGADTALPVPHASIYTGNARGYHFTAPVDFTITGLEVAIDAGPGNQHVAVLKTNNNAPWNLWSAPIVPFTTLFLAQNASPTGYIPVNIPIKAGDVIAILGQRGTGNSYSPASSIEIDGLNVPIQRFIMQNQLDNTAPASATSLGYEASTSISRVNFTYSAGCETPRTMVTGTVVCTVGEEEMVSGVGAISILPNPSKGIFKLIGSNVEEQVEVSIFNSTGKMVYQLDKRVSNDFDQQIDLSGLAKGIYFVRLQGEKSMDMKKIVVQ